MIELGNMEKRVKRLMANMSGADLGKLVLKDVVGALAGHGNVYTKEELQAVINKLDGKDAREYSRYSDIMSHIHTLTLMYWWVCKIIENITLKLDIVQDSIRFCTTSEAASQALLFQRISMAEPTDPDPDSSEIEFRNTARKLSENILQNKEQLAGLHSDLEGFATASLSLETVLRSLAEMLELPELVSIAESPLQHVDELLQRIRAELPEGSPYREIFPDIDTAALEPDETDVKLYMSRILELLKG